jgi:glycosyltransferase involved in cell wall biosynthesis
MGERGARSREAWRVLRRDGARGLAQRAARVAYRRVGAADLEDPLDFDRITDSRGLKLAVPDRRPSRGTPLTVGWICTPPAPGSGGHTTLLRMVAGVEAAGHTCVLYLYDRFQGELARHERTVRRHWPDVRAEVRSVADGLAPLDAYVASGWETAHVLASAAVPTRRLYFIQDFEPLFYPLGSHHVLAEDTYRFGFRAITVGPVLARLLRERYGVEAAVAEFGCDTGVYRLTHRGARAGVVFYARRETARRGFELGALALREFHRRHPDHPVHLFGDPAARVPGVPAHNHGVLRPAELAELYNRCAAGLALSFTNLSLVPDEMLACGLPPVVGVSEYARGSIANPYVRWAAPTPYALADALSEAVREAPDPATIAGSVRPTPWTEAQKVTVDTLEHEVYG